MSQPKSIFGHKLREFREDREKTQAQLGELIGYSRKTINAWENGRRKGQPDRDMVLAIAQNLDLDGIEKNELLEAAGYASELIEGEEIEGAELSAIAVRREARRGAQEAIETTMLVDKQTPGPIPTRVPKPRATAFVGRETEKEWLKQRLLSGEQVALAGIRAIGGMGKTELAISVARSLASDFPGGVIWLDCGVNHALAIQDRLAQAIGLELPPDNLPVRADALTRALKQREKTFIVMDDVRRRHLADFDYLLPPNPPCAVLVTSRRDDLPLSQDAIRKLDVLPEEQGEELFTHLLQLYGLPATTAEVKEIAALLEQIPLALTLAAGRAQRISRYDSEPIAVLRVQLEERRLGALAIGDDRPDLSIAITFTLSFEDLEEAEQWGLAQLGIFARNEFDQVAVEAVWEKEAAAAKTILDRLSFAGLIEQTGPNKWWMHDLLREYAGERLGDFKAEAMHMARSRHAAFWGKVLHNIELKELEDWQTLAIYRPEIEMAADWLLHAWQDNPRQAVALALNIGRKLYVFNLLQAVDWLRTGMAAAAEIDESSDRGWLAYYLAFLLGNRGQYDEAERLYRESLAVKEAIGDSRGVAVTQVGIADLMARRGNYKEAEKLYLSCLDTCKSIQDWYSVGAILVRLSQLLVATEKRAEAVPVLLEAREIFQKLQAESWLQQVEQLLVQAQTERLTLNDLIAMVKSARQGDDTAGQKVKQICRDLGRNDDPPLASLGKGLSQFLDGVALELALDSVPDEMREEILRLLRET